MGLVFTEHLTFMHVQVKAFLVVRILLIQGSRDGVYERRKLRVCGHCGKGKAAGIGGLPGEQISVLCPSKLASFKQVGKCLLGRRGPGNQKCGGGGRKVEMCLRTGE